MASSRTDLELPGPVVLVICEILTITWSAYSTFFEPGASHVFMPSRLCFQLPAKQSKPADVRMFTVVSGHSDLFRRRQPGTLTWPEHGPSGRQLAFSAAKTAKAANQTPKAQ